MLKLLAFDYGAGSGRAILGRFNGGKLELEEVHRFSNEPVMASGTIYWDVLRLFHEMKQGVLKCKKDGNGDLAGIGTDTWGVDFGLLGQNGELLGNPVHYRDGRNEGMIEKACKIISKREIYEQTGLQFLKFNTLYQLLSMKLNNSSILEKASTMLFMPDLLNYFLTGEKTTEYTIASTSQMLDIWSGDWAKPFIEKMGIPLGILTEIINPGTIIGNTSNFIKDELGIGSIPVIAVAGHDTGSAVISVPSERERFAYLSSGTWSLLGIESPGPIVNDTAYELDYTNEGGFNRTIRFLKNIMGMWIYEECRRAWGRKGEVTGYSELEEAASKAEPFVSLIDPDNDLFYSPGYMPDRIAEFCRKTGQIVPESKGAFVRCILESLAFRYRMGIEGLEKIAGYTIPALHVVGGGSKNDLLNRFTANAIGRPVITGPAEATAVGNLACQLIALGEVSGLSQARQLIRRSFSTKRYLPSDNEAWDEAYEKFCSIASLY